MRLSPYKRFKWCLKQWVVFPLNGRAETLKQSGIRIECLPQADFVRMGATCMVDDLEYLEF